MRPLLVLILAGALLPACAGADGDLTARVEALEARYHTQQRQIDALKTEIDALKASKDAPVMDLSEGEAPEGEGQ